jgi:hypothetical protein
MRGFESSLPSHDPKVRQFEAVSSRGPGRSPLKAKTGVRIPVPLPEFESKIALLMPLDRLSDRHALTDGLLASVFNNNRLAVMKRDKGKPFGGPAVIHEFHLRGFRVLRRAVVWQEIEGQQPEAFPDHLRIVSRRNNIRIIHQLQIMK